MKNKKPLIITLIILVLIVAATIYVYFIKKDEKTSLTINEKQWIEKNQNNLIDLAIPSDVPILSNNGDGLIFDFLDDLEKDTGLSFNKLSYVSSSKPTSDYIIKKVKTKNNKDILIYQDNYVLISASKIKYSEPSQINNVVIGVLKNNEAKIKKALGSADKITYKTYKTNEELFKAQEDNEVDVLAVECLENLDSIITDKNLHIIYNITEDTTDYVISLGNIDILNNILKKYYAKWQEEHYNEDYNKNIAETYFTIKEVAEKEQVKFRSKRYSYGFVQNAPFDVVISQGLRGYNYGFLEAFAKATNIEIDYKKYSNLNVLSKEFGENKLDIIFDYKKQTDYNMDVYNTVSLYDEKISIITDQNTNISINSINSLSGKEVYVVEDSKIAAYLNKNGVKTKTYQNLNDLINHLNKNSLAAIDYYSYDYYVRNKLNNYKNIYTFTLDDDYSFISRDISANKTFNELFDFYLTFIDSNKSINNSYRDLLNSNNNNKLFKILIVVFSAILFVLLGIITGKFIKKHKNPYPKLSKTDKLRYIDNLTSLKNRDYLNDNVSAWENSNIYPQAVIIVDLNNIAYINDNFGHAEGDKVIVEGAGILINNQLPNSEIIRSNGNEFLIFVLEQDEKQIISYIRKLNKEFKEISHGFGAAIGYSIITDEVKTIDDAVNEAALDMRNNKEENKQ